MPETPESFSSWNSRTRRGASGAGITIAVGLAPGVAVAAWAAEDAEDSPNTPRAMMSATSVESGKNRDDRDRVVNGAEPTGGSACRGMRALAGPARPTETDAVMATLSPKRVSMTKFPVVDLTTGPVPICGRTGSGPAQRAGAGRVSTSRERCSVAFAERHGGQSAKDNTM